MKRRIRIIAVDVIRASAVIMGQNSASSRILEEYDQRTQNGEKLNIAHTGSALVLVSATDEVSA